MQFLLFHLRKVNEYIKENIRHLHLGSQFLW
jgi:hypothetical protein